MALYDSQTTNRSKRTSRTFRDIDLDFTRNSVTNDINVVENVVAVKRALKNLVQTIFLKGLFNQD